MLIQANPATALTAAKRHDQRVRLLLGDASAKDELIANHPANRGRIDQLSVHHNSKSRGLAFSLEFAGDSFRPSLITLLALARSSTINVNVSVSMLNR